MRGRPGGGFGNLTTMRVLVTGAAGFLGNALLPQLACHHELIGLDVRQGGAAGVEWLVGDIADGDLHDRAATLRPDALIHLATVPGGAAEQSPDHAWEINVEASRRLVTEVARARPGLRVVFASSIAALGPLSTAVDDNVPLRPRLHYGAHKVLIETWLGTLARRGEIFAVSLRLPGLVARPRGPSGMKSAFLSELFHAALAGAPFVSPVGPNATMWMMSVTQCAANIAHALSAPQHEPFAFTLPSIRATMHELVAEIGRQRGYEVAQVRYEADPVIEADFGSFPPLSADAALRLGFRAENNLAALVKAAFSSIEREQL